MGEAQKILKMIESVDPNDTNTLDEIDARVWCYLNNKNPEELFKTDFNGPVSQWYYVFYCSSFLGLGGMLYTRSRDALKAIRPEGWFFQIISGPKGFKVELHHIKQKFVIAGILPTEELAELYAIIQAIEWERSQCK